MNSSAEERSRVREERRGAEGGSRGEEQGRTDLWPGWRVDWPAGADTGGERSAWLGGERPAGRE
jgi:hypothetical protein